MVTQQVLRGATPQSQLQRRSIQRIEQQQRANVELTEQRLEDIAARLRYLQEQRERQQLLLSKSMRRRFQAERSGLYAEQAYLQEALATPNINLAAAREQATELGSATRLTESRRIRRAVKKTRKKIIPEYFIEEFTKGEKTGMKAISAKGEVIEIKGPILFCL